MGFTAMAAFFTTSSLGAGEVYGADLTSRGRFDLAGSHAAWLEGFSMMIFPDEGGCLSVEASLFGKMGEGRSWNGETGSSQHNTATRCDNDNIRASYSNGLVKRHIQ